MFHSKKEDLVAETLTHEAFARHLKTKFQVQLDAGNSVELQLIEVSELKSYERQEEFWILFLGPNEFFLGQGTRLVDHDVMGQFDLFLVPIKQDDQGYYYEAVFNRIFQPEKTAS